MQLRELLKNPSYHDLTIKKAKVRGGSGDFFWLNLESHETDGRYALRHKMCLRSSDGLGKALVERFGSVAAIAKKIIGAKFFRLALEDAYGKDGFLLKSLREDPDAPTSRLCRGLPEMGIYAESEGRPVWGTIFTENSASHEETGRVPIDEHATFEDEKKFRERHGYGRTWNWKQAGIGTEKGVRKTVRAINRLPFAFTFGWSHSNLPSDHNGYVPGTPEQEKKKGGTQTHGYVNFRANPAHSQFKKLKEEIAKADGKITLAPEGKTVAGTYKTFRRQPIYRLNVNLQNHPTEREAFEKEMAKAWRRINSAIRKVKSE